jgi:PAS domain S-box-containing protein
MSPLGPAPHVPTRGLQSRSTISSVANAPARESWVPTAGPIDWRHFFDISHELLCVADFDGRFVALNTAWERFGHPLGELEGRPYADFVHPEDRAATAAETARLVAGASTVAFENRLRRRDGSYRLLRWSAASDVGRRLIYGAAQELGDEAVERSTGELEEARLRAQKMEAVGRLAGGIAHDFNNLLTAIGGYAEMLLTSLVDEGQRADCEEILRASQRDTELTRQLLLFGRPQAFEPRLVDLNATVAASERMLRRLVGEEVELSVDLQPGLPPVVADPGKIEQVLVNLVVNGRDAMSGRGSLTVETEQTAPQEIAGQVALRVRDSGPGIDPAVRESIFEPFFTTKATGRGTGLGLATVYSIVQQLNGSIRVGGGPGKGAEFEVLLPAPGGGNPQDSP